ncbi:hypothetical protein HYR69_11315 [Candidatus Sumerlaeota bacterium]|nr:hypothetical protein [Candidatus Sumerlaeota bacterium]
MPETPRQNYQNHRVYDRAFTAAAILLLLALIGGLIALIKSPGWISINFLLLAGAVVAMFLRQRRYALRVQDRVIRLEMRLRLERLLDDDLKAQAKRLTVKQLIGLRFASDVEMPDLVRKIISENIQTADEIKRLVKDWQADDLRV